MFVSENLLVASTQITHQFSVALFDVAMQVRPSQACNVAVSVWAVVPQEKYSVLEDDVFLVLYPKVFVRPHEVCLGKLFVPLCSIVREYYIGCFSLNLLATFRELQSNITNLTICAVTLLVQCSQPEGADVTCLMVARCNRQMFNSRSADEAHFSLFHRLVLVLSSLLANLTLAALLTIYVIIYFADIRGMIKRSCIIGS
jgi:hypothetical protein